MSATGYRHITYKPGVELYSDHNREREFVCQTCGQPFTARTPNALHCGVCRLLTPKARRAQRARRLGRG